MRKLLLVLVLLVGFAVASHAEVVKYISSSYTYCTDEYNCYDFNERSVITVNTSTNTITVAGKRTVKFTAFNSYVDNDGEYPSAVIECTDPRGSYIAIRFYFDYDDPDNVISIFMQYGSETLEYDDITVQKGSSSKSSGKKSSSKSKSKSRKR